MARRPRATDKEAAQVEIKPPRADTAADALIEGIMRWGVDTVFGLPGDGINGLMEALRKRQDKIKFIQVRHEESAAFMACGYAKYTGKLGVCLATTGPGAVHLLNGLYDAKMDGAPVLALTGMTYHDLVGTFYQQDVNTQALFEDVALYYRRRMGARHVDIVTNIACRSALARKGVAHITFPVDLQESPVPSPTHISPKTGWGHSSDVYVVPDTCPRPNDLDRAARILNDGKRVVILAGQGALGAGDELEQLAEKVAGPIVKPLLGKAVVPDESPYTTGGTGFLGTRPSQEAMEEADTLIMVGTSFPYLDYMPKPGQARGVQIDIDPQRVGLRYPVELGLIGDSKAVLQALLPLVKRKEDRGFLEKAQKGMQKWWKLMEERSSKDVKPIKPQAVAWTLSELADDNAIISCDSGTIATWISRQFKIRRGQKFSLSGNLATMAPGLPYSIAAKIAYPDRQSIAFVGDGGFTMLMGEFATAVKYNLPIIVVVIKNNHYGMIQWEQMVFLGNPQYGVEIQPIDFAKFAEACGGLGFSVEDPKDIRPTLEKALHSGRPSVVEVLVDPYEPPWPAKIQWQQARNMALAMMRGQPNRQRIALTMFRDKVDDLFK
ncbi:MAG: thiamine pyrophosphate-binding protein [Chloroflexi bacterium]|nr:thiamine pyrophosphate-binding protein [Chloroflexota bacterium]